MSHGVENGAQRRVILVGRTGLDRSLRADRRVELIRAADTLDAIGELSDPIDAESPRASVVVVSAEAGPEGPERAAFVGALRAIDPHVAVLLASAGGDASEYDALIDPSSTGEDLARIVSSLGVGQNGVAPQADACPAGGGATVRAMGRTIAGEDDDADAGPLRAALAGHDPVGEAVRGAAARLGRDDLELVRGAAAPAGLSVPLRAGQAVLGHLLVRGAGEGERGDAALLGALEREAEGIALWWRLHEQQRQLRVAAFTDPMTGAWNRRYFDRYLEAAIEQVRTARLPLTVMVFDIDNFKAYNDQFGHAAGDEILIETVRLLRSVIRPSDRVCRIGGDEFAVVFYEPTGPRTAASRPPESVYKLAKRFQRQICEHRFPKLGAEAEGTLTISGGLATYPWDGTDGPALLARADELALQSKRQGKNVITLGPGAESVCNPDAGEGGDQG